MNEKIKINLPLREQVCNIIRGRIYRGELESGTMLSERSVSRELGISTTPIKEAFRVLTAEGLLVTLPRKGAQVTDVATNLEYVNFIRSALEGVAAYLAARNITPEQEAIATAEKPAASSWTQHYLTGLGIGLGVVAVVGGGYFLVRRKRHA